MSITRTGSFDPFRRAMNDMFENMERDFFGPSALAPYPRMPSALMANPSTALSSTNYGMNLDFHETDNGYELSADLPGMSKEDITVDVDNESRVLTVTGERKRAHEESNDGTDGGAKYHFVERSYGKTSRSIRLPETADIDNANASYEAGVLRLGFPKKGEASKRNVRIPIGGEDQKMPLEDEK